ncbi:AbrB family transcriptional regulator [Endozoicomonas sp. (ex Bugula neritina AB1)]|nr:AbrB family transcriptional regulator [Endozoicomonas sp. (ex Bugula neritina AB1)]
MPLISSKRQITLPAEQCRLAGLAPGDEYESFIDNHGHITIVKKTKGAARGLLKGTKTDQRYSDETSMQTGINP